ncbi:MAG: hydroxymethylbilane synthase [Myxococcaceae bacterium]
MRLRIATRRSPLALWQADAVAAMLRALRPGARVDRLELTTSGDRFLSGPLAQVGGKGLFVKEIEEALLQGEAEVAVHSLKDLTSHMPEGLVLAAVPEREDPRDAWVSPTDTPFRALPKNARVGTASVRRACQLRAARPDIEIVPLRGNVQRRLDKMVEMGLHGAVLAMAGLKRLGLERRVTEALSPELCLPSVGQGALALQCRADDGVTRSVLELLNHAPTRAVVEAERGFLATLEGGCSLPMAAFGELHQGRVRLRGLIGSMDGVTVLRGEVEGSAGEGAALGKSLANQLLRQGGEAMLANARRASPEPAR